MLRNTSNLITIVIVIVLILMLSGCASKKPQPDPVDSATQTLQRSAAGAYNNGRYKQAEILYRNVLNAALTRDEPRQIIDARFNLALTATALGKYKQALLHLDQADAERRRRAIAEDREIGLLRATIDYRSGNFRRAEAGMAILIDDPDTNPQTRKRAHFIIGLIGADQSDIDKLSKHMSAANKTAVLTDNADHLELKARLSGLEGDLVLAQAQFDAAIEKRRDERDYRGMVRALAACGQLLAESKPAIAANYYLRAGRSAAQREEPETREWLKQAIKLDRNNLVLVAEAQELLERVD